MDVDHEEGGYNAGDDYYRDFDFWLPRVTRLCESLAPGAEHQISYTRHHHPMVNFPDSKVFTLSFFFDEPNPKEYFLILPEEVDGFMSRVLALRFLEERIRRAGYSFRALKVPQVWAWDARMDNELRYPYVLVKRMSGVILEQAWEYLSMQHKVDVAREMATLYQELMLVEGQVSGWNIAGDPGVTIPKASEVCPTCNGRAFDDIISEYGSGPMFEASGRRGSSNGGPSVMEMAGLLERHGRCSTNAGLLRKRTLPRRGHAVSSGMDMDANNFSLSELLEQMKTHATSSVLGDALGGVSPTTCLWHPNLIPANIMVKFSPNGTCAITGVFGWEAPLFNHQFMVARPPCWLWRNRRIMADGRPDDLGDDREPLDRNLVEADSPYNAAIKRTFDVAVGDEWRQLAYHPALGLARRIMNLSLADDWGARHYHQLEDIVATCKEHSADEELQHAIDQLGL